MIVTIRARKEEKALLCVKWILTLRNYKVSSIICTMAEQTDFSLCAGRRKLFLQIWRFLWFSVNRKDESAMAKCKHHPGQKRLNYTANTTSVQRAEKNSEWSQRWAQLNTEAAMSSPACSLHFYLHLFLQRDHHDNCSKASLGWFSTLLCFIGFVFVINR